MAFSFSDGLSSGATTSLITVTVTATFGSAVSGVTVSDFTVSGATKGSLVGSGAVYEVALTFGSSASVTVDMGASSGAVSFANAAATQVALTYGTVFMTCNYGCCTYLLFLEVYLWEASFTVCVVCARW